MSVVLRCWQEKDIESLAKNANHKEVAAQLRNTFPYPYTIEDAKFFIGLTKQVNEDKELVYAIVYQDEAVGGITLNIKDDVNEKCAEIGYWLGVEHWGKGIASKAVKQLVDIAFSKFDIIRIYAEFFETNIGSLKVLEKNGFEFEGRLRKSIYKDGNIYDSLIYGLIKE